MDGLLIIDKPAGMTSHDVVSRVRRVLRTKRVGHTGTLDPFATGVMVLLIGNATRLARFLDKDAKEYIAEVRFGFETDTGDNTGRRKAEGEGRNEEIVGKLNATDWEGVFEKFRGQIMQTPPMYSAKKIEGKKLYELARQGKEIERKPARVSIHELKLLAHEDSPPSRDEGVAAASPGTVVGSKGVNTAIRIRVVCSAGTYIRTLAEDIGREIGVGAHLTNLRRTAAGKFDLQQSLTIEDLKNLEEPESALLPLQLAVAHLPEFALPDDRIGPTKNGLASRIEGEKYGAGEFVRMTLSGGNLVAVGLYDHDEKVIRPKVVLI
ncbi:MAG TPA: tRNA pseudouridine(55) synthase TruB [Pyrinomonadaceae bacterium]|nr:tRNA pseudouridine(55) synthase TruB [Pyrinomonadaceae bacterium]